MSAKKEQDIRRLKFNSFYLVVKGIRILWKLKGCFVFLNEILTFPYLSGCVLHSKGLLMHFLDIRRVIYGHLSAKKSMILRDLNHE